MQEEWNEIPHFPGYAVSTLGRILSVHRDLIMRPSKNQQGMAKIGLMRGGKQYQRAIAPIVADVYLPKPDDYDPDVFNTPINMNMDRMDCSVHNLQWRPHWFAIKFHQQVWYREYISATPHIYDVDTDEEYHTLSEPSQKFGLLCVDIKKSLVDKHRVFPTHQLFQYV